VLFGAIGDNGNDVRDIFVSTRYRSELWKFWAVYVCLAVREATNGKRF